MTKTFELNIKGYYRDEVRTKFPQLPGIYVVYRGILNNITRTCILKEMLYIGETDNIYNCLNEHNTRNRFLQSLKQEETIFYTYAITDIRFSDRKRIADSLIYELKPTLNRNEVISYPYSTTTINVIGDRHAFIPNIINAPTY